MEFRIKGKMKKKAWMEKWERIKKSEDKVKQITDI